MRKIELFFYIFNTFLLGGTNHINAYCLIYVHDELIHHFITENLPLRSYSAFEEEKIDDLYSDFLSKTDIFKEILTDNLKFIEEVENYKIRNKLSIIFDDYNREFQFINEMERKLKEAQEKSDNKKIPFNPTLNFPIFLRFHKGNKDRKFEPYINYTLANHCLTNTCPELKGLDFIDEFPPLWLEKVKEQMKKIAASNKFKAIELDINKSEYYELMNVYHETCYNLAVSSFFLNKANQNLHEMALFGAIHLKKNFGEKIGCDPFFVRVVLEFFKIFALFFCTKIAENLRKEAFDDVNDKRKTHFFF